MRKAAAALGSLVLFVVAPGVVAGLVPWWLTAWRFEDPLPFWGPVRVLGAVLAAAGLAVLIPAFVRFVVEGLGTPAPVAPTERLVVGGLYRYLRNPMYLAVLALIVGQALLFGQLGLLWCRAFIALAFVAFVYGYEEPTLLARYRSEYEDYRRRVPGWWPRLRS